jgi:GNAT superfamily N-acetyltransferase
MTPSPGAPFIRQYRREDRPKLEAMYRGFEPKGAAEGLPPVRDEKIQRWLDYLDGQAHSLVAFAGESEERISGHVILAGGEDGDLELALFVHQDFRGQGLGLALAQAAVREARRLGARRIWLTVTTENRAALRIYERCGFRALPGKWLMELEMELLLS